MKISDTKQALKLRILTLTRQVITVIEYVKDYKRLAVSQNTGKQQEVQECIWHYGFAKEHCQSIIMAQKMVPCKTSISKT
jgi:hypothetical protein